jgi:hypothetical protein
MVLQTAGPDICLGTKQETVCGIKAGAVEIETRCESQFSDLGQVIPDLS